MNKEQKLENNFLKKIREYINVKWENRLEEQKSIIRKLSASNAANCLHKKKYKIKINELKSENQELKKIIKNLQK